MAMVIKLFGGLTLWAFGFSALYALHGYGCASGWGQRVTGPFTLLGLALILLWLAMLLIGGLFAFAMQRWPAGGDEMMMRLTRIGAWGGLIGLLFTGAPAALPAHCL